MVPRIARNVLLILWVCFIPSQSRAGTELDFWHAYRHQPTGITHFSFHIANYKRGLFFGSCGPSTRSLKWSYDIDLTGPGPLYTTNEIGISAEGRPITIMAGTITISNWQKIACIQLQTRSSGTNYTEATTAFPGNGVHRIHKLK